MEVGVKKSSKRKLVRSAWADHVETNYRLKIGSEQMPRK